MPLIEITYSPNVSTSVLQSLGEVLPEIVSVAVECPEEPYDGNLQPGDVEIRFRERSRFDVGGLDAVIEVRSKWFSSRVDNRQERSDLIYERVAHETDLKNFGVYLIFPVAAWSQTE